MTNSRPCTGCGRILIWASTAAGKAVPLEKVPVFEIDGENVARKTDAFVLVNHFMTCPKAAQFSGRGKAHGAENLKAAMESRNAREA